MFLDGFRSSFWTNIGMVSSGFKLVIEKLVDWLFSGFGQVLCWFHAVDLKMASSGFRLVLELLIDSFNSGFWTGYRLVIERFLEWFQADNGLLLDLYSTGFWTDTGIVFSSFNGS